MKRRTGNTFRKISKALVAASEGSKVGYVSHLPTTKRFYFDMAVKIVSSCLSGDIKISKSTSSILFPSGGRLEFISVEDIDKKRRGNELMEFNDD